MSLSQPNACTPFSCAVCTTAAESVFCISMSTPWPISVVAASRSLPGSNHLLTQTTLTVAFGLTLRAPSANESMLRITSGIGTDATTPILPVLLILPATTPARYAPS